MNIKEIIQVYKKLRGLLAQLFIYTYEDILGQLTKMDEKILNKAEKL